MMRDPSQIPQPPMPPVPMPPPMAPNPDAAMGKFARQTPQHPDQAARAAYQEAQASGQDGRQAAKQTWMAAVEEQAARITAPGYKPLPEEENLVIIAKRLQDDGYDPAAAVGMAHGFMAGLAANSRPPPGAPPQPAPGG